MGKRIIRKITGMSLYVITLFFLFLGLTYLIWAFYLNIKTFFDFQASVKLIFQFILNLVSLFLETFGIFYTTLLFYHMANSSYFVELPHAKIMESEIEDYPKISVIIPVNNPLQDVLRETLNSLSKVNYPKSKLDIIVGDDTIDEELSYKIEELSKKYNARYFYFPSNKHFKAGMLNEILKSITTKYVFFLDYDHIIFPDILRKCVHVLEQDEKIAYIQTKVNFRAIKSKLQLWESVMYAQFFEIFGRSKSRRNKTIFNGSSACFRAEILKKIGGIPIYSFTEDIAITVEILKENYKGILLDEYGSLGLVPAKFDKLISQVVRWAKGQLRVFLKKRKEILRSKLPIFDKIDLIFSISLFSVASLLYFSGFFYSIMFFSNIPLIRPPVKEFLPLLIIPIFFSLSYYLSGILAISFANQSYMKYKYSDLVFFYIFALVFNPFTIYALVKAVLKNRTPIKGKDIWNEDIPIYSYLLFVTVFGGLLVTTAVLDFLKNSIHGSFWLGLGILGISMLFTLPLTIYFERKTKKNNIYQINSNIKDS